MSLNDFVPINLPAGTTPWWFSLDDDNGLMVAPLLAEWMKTGPIKTAMTAGMEPSEHYRLLEDSASAKGAQRLREASAKHRRPTTGDQVVVLKWRNSMESHRTYVIEQDDRDSQPYKIQGGWFREDEVRLQEYPEFVGGYVDIITAVKMGMFMPGKHIELKSIGQLQVHMPKDFERGADIPTVVCPMNVALSGFRNKVQDRIAVHTHFFRPGETISPSSFLCGYLCGKVQGKLSDSDDAFLLPCLPASGNPLVKLVSGSHAAETRREIEQ